MTAREVFAALAELEAIIRKEGCPACGAVRPMPCLHVTAIVVAGREYGVVALADEFQEAMERRREAQTLL